MNGYTLTLLETTGIQDYIFGSNNLGINIGASELVTRVTSNWLFDALPSPHNLTWGPKTELKPQFLEDLKIESNNLEAEVIYRGGGNALILFAGREQAENFTRILTSRVLLDAPGLQVVIAHQDISWDAQVLRDVFLKKLRPALSARKMDRRAPAPLPGLGITAACVFTGQPASHRGFLKAAEERAGENKKLFSDEIEAKHRAEPGGKQRLKVLFPQLEDKYLFAYDFDNFGEKGEYSQIAVIHADGNQMGKRIEKHLKPYDSPEKNRDCVKALRSFSERVKEVAKTALKGTVDRLIDARDEEGGWTHPGQKASSRGKSLHVPPVFWRDRAGQNWIQVLPFRPIVFGGDDVTFVADGRLGLALAYDYLERLAAERLADGERAYSRAGVAIVRSHFPFSRAYELAENLSSTVKRSKAFENLYPNLSALDWHYAVSGLVQELDEIRAQEYTVQSGILHMRPVRVDPEQDRGWHNWKVFNDLVTTFQVGEWQAHRNKLKAFREALRDGPQAVEQFRLYYLEDKHLQPIPGLPDMQLRGWFGEECGYFDAIEAMDFFIPL